MLKPITSDNLQAPDIRHGFFTREGGVSEGIYAGLNTGLGSSDDPARVLENRRRVAEHLGASHGSVVTLYQVHGATALTVDKPQDRTNLPKADAVVSSTPGLAIGVLTADCTPVLFADPEAGVVAAAHAGWRGAVGGILEAAISEMERQGLSARTSAPPSVPPLAPRSTRSDRISRRRCSGSTPVTSAFFTPPRPAHGYISIFPATSPPASPALA